MKDRVNVKNVFLIVAITTVFIGLGVGSTFAMFNIIASIENPIEFNSNLNSNNALAETVEVTIPSGEEKDVELVISNTSEGGLFYAAWYMTSSNNLSIESESSNNSYGPVGSMPSDSSFTLTVTLRNNSSASITVTLGVSSSSNTIVLPAGAVEIPS